MEHGVRVGRHDPRGRTRRRDQGRAQRRGRSPARARRAGGHGAGLSGTDLALHPDFDRNRVVYISYTKPLDEKRTTLAVARAVWDGKGFTGTTDIFVGEGGSGGPIAFGGDGMLYVASTAEAAERHADAQQPRRQDPAAHR